MSLSRTRILSPCVNTVNPPLLHFVYIHSIMTEYGYLYYRFLSQAAHTSNKNISEFQAIHKILILYLSVRKRYEPSQLRLGCSVLNVYVSIYSTFLQMGGDFSSVNAKEAAFYNCHPPPHMIDAHRRQASQLAGWLAG